MAGRGNSCLAHVVTLREVFSHFLLLEGERRAKEAIADLLGTGLVERADIDSSYRRSVGRIKATVRQASLADGFGLALAQQLGGTVVTAGHPAFEQAAAQGIRPVTFIR